MLEKQYASQVTNFFCFQAEATAEPCPGKNESPMASAGVQVVFVKKIPLPMTPKLFLRPFFQDTYSCFFCISIIKFLLIAYVFSCVLNSVF